MTKSALPGFVDLPTVLVLRLEKLCTQFEAAWRGPQRPRIEDYLADVDEPGRVFLLKELLLLEFDYRRSHGENPQLQDYCARFPSLDPDSLAELLGESPHGAQPPQLPPVKGSRDTRSVPTDRTASESRELPEIPGYKIFVRLPKGTFFMGWNGVPRSVKRTEIKEDFEFAVHVVTQGQWEAIMGNNPSWFSRQGKGWEHVRDISDQELKLFPVESVSWNDAEEFIKRLNENERGRGYLYRLPSETEWEYACRGGATSLEECSYHFYFDKPTNDLSSKQANFNGNNPFGKRGEKGPFLQRPSRVGSYPPNKLGLCDMHGNVWQWTDTGNVLPLADQEILVSLDKVYRGGSWSLDGTFCRAALQYTNTPIHRDYDHGFRLARVPVR